jgi:uncharacterized membrane protein (DUF441 family)
VRNEAAATVSTHVDDSAVRILTILHFGPDQNDVFLVALVGLLLATIAICLPIAASPAVRRRIPRRAIAAAIALAIVGFGVATWQGANGIRTLADERQGVRTAIETRYGLQLTVGQVQELINGGRPLVSLPEAARLLALSSPTECKTLALRPHPKSTNRYDLALGGTLLPQPKTTVRPAPVCVPKPSPSPTADS